MKTKTDFNIKARNIIWHSIRTRSEFSFKLCHGHLYHVKPTYHPDKFEFFEVSNENTLEVFYMRVQDLLKIMLSRGSFRSIKTNGRN